MLNFNVSPYGVEQGRKKAMLLKITRVRSDIGRPYKQRQTLIHLGLRRTHQSVVREDSPLLRGMLQKVAHLITVEPVEATEQS